MLSIPNYQNEFQLKISGGFVSETALVDLRGPLGSLQFLQIEFSVSFNASLFRVCRENESEWEVGRLELCQPADGVARNRLRLALDGSPLCSPPLDGSILSPSASPSHSAHTASFTHFQWSFSTFHSLLSL